MWARSRAQTLCSAGGGSRFSQPRLSWAFRRRLVQSQEGGRDGCENVVFDVCMRATTRSATRQRMGGGLAANCRGIQFDKHQQCCQHPPPTSPHRLLPLLATTNQAKNSDGGMGE
jgi:hypothetical protein